MLGLTKEWKLREADNYIGKGARNAQWDVWAVNELLSLELTSPRDFIGRLGWEPGSSHLDGRTRHGSDTQEELTS